MVRDSNEEAVKKQVALLRDGYDIGIYPDYIPLMCNECDEENFKFSLFNNLGYEQISLVRLGIEEPFHRASILGFNSDTGSEWFIVDPTYGQFFENNKFRSYMEKNYIDFSATILSQGYIRCNLENILAYMAGFIYSNAFCSNVDSNLVYQNVDTFLKDSKIISSNENVKDFEQSSRKK